MDPFQTDTTIHVRGSETGGAEAGSGRRPCLQSRISYRPFPTRSRPSSGHPHAALANLKGERATIPGSTGLGWRQIEEVDCARLLPDGVARRPRALPRRT